MPFGRGHGGAYEATSLSLPLTPPAFRIEESEGKTIAIKQTITAGNNFTGVAPTTTAALAGAVYTYPADSQGGLFSPGNNNTTLQIVGIELDLSDQTAWDVSLIDNDSNAFLLFSGTTEGEFVTTADTIVNLLPGETVQVTTTGASQPLIATIKFKNTRTR